MIKLDENQTQEVSRLDQLKEKMNNGTGLNIEERDEYNALMAEAGEVPVEEEGGNVDNSVDNAEETASAEGDENVESHEGEQTEEVSEEQSGEQAQETQEN